MISMTDIAVPARQAVQSQDLAHLNSNEHVLKELVNKTQN